MRKSRSPIILAAALLLCCHAAATPAPAQTTLDVRIGWEGWVNPGRWNLMHVTLADTRTRNVTLEFHTPYDNYNGIRIGQQMTIGPQPQTFPLYLPLRHLNPDDLSVIVRDVNTRKRIAHHPSPTSSLRGGTQMDPTRHLLGVSGRRVALRQVTVQLRGARLEAGYLDPAELPTDPIGFDALDVLVLNAPDMNALSGEQQQAIADWVRAGGNLVIWPSDDPVPASGALVDLLPCRVGGSSLIEQPLEKLRAAGLSPRFRKLPTRDLSPATGAEPVVLLDAKELVAYRGRAGFGRVFVSPTDLSALVFNDSKSSWKLWRVVLDGMIRDLPEDGVTEPQNRFYGIGETGMREGMALRHVGDMLGDVPGAGRFGFGYVAGVMIGMMLVVGPLDWFVLKKLGRQPWTWATTGGWIALVSLSAVYAGHVFKSGDLHFRTFELVDQADGAVVGRTHLAAVYSPRTAKYDLKTPTESWWHPASPGENYYYYRRSAGNEVAFHQTYRGNSPEPMVVNVWNLKYLRGGSTAKGPALIDASLSVKDGGASGERIVGTVTNLGPAPLRNVAVRTKAGLSLFAARAPGASRIEPGQTVTVDAQIDPEPKPVDPNPKGQRYYGYGGIYPPGMRMTHDPTRLWDSGGNLSARRTDGAARWLADRDDLACVYGEFESPGPAVKLPGHNPIERHWKVVRALVPLRIDQPQ